MSGPGQIILLPDAEAIYEAAAARVLLLATERVAATGRFLLALAGGRTPGGLYQRLAEPPFLEQMPWQQLRVIWGDERYVPPDDPQSNYRLSREALLAQVPIPTAHIYPIPTDAVDPHQAAAAYDQRLQSLLAEHQGQIDLLLLGMGTDGHTASLFPAHPALDAPAAQLVAAVDAAPKPPAWRISLTIAALNRAAHVLLLVSGADKAATLQAVLHGPYQPRRLPVQAVRPPQGSITWLVDQAAGSLIVPSALPLSG